MQVYRATILKSVQGGVYVNDTAGKFFLSTQFQINVVITNTGGEKINDWWVSQDIKVPLHDPSNTQDNGSLYAK